MTEANVIQSIASQAPGVVGVIVVVIYFLKSIEKRDNLFTEAMQNMTERLASMENLLIAHDTQSRGNYQAIIKADERIENKLKTKPRIRAVKA